MGHVGHSRYWRRFLLPGEKAIHTFGISNAYIFVFWGVPLVFFLLLAVVAAGVNELIGLMFLVPAMVLVIPILYMRFFVHYAITDRRVMEREGFFHIKFVTVDMRSITDITISEPFWERIFIRSGDIGVNTAGSPRVELEFKHVGRPFERRQDIYRHQQHAIRRFGAQTMAQAQKP